jgi:iron complex outermembrane receptor protein
MFNLFKYSLVSVLTLGLFSTPTFAQDSDEDADVEEVIVTGSRIGRSEYSGINPVTLITSEDIEASGQLNISEVLRSTVQNTLGSTYEGFQNGAVDANISLRGAGSGRTLILLDGKRMPGSPKQAGAAANINVIPTAAIDRVEILTDGASAIYGGDAAAGVVNVILKDSFEGVTFRGGTTEPDMPGGKEDSFSVTVGGSGERSSFVMTLEHQERNTIYWKDRWYTKSSGTESDDYADWNKVSQGSRTYVNGDTFQYLPMAACVNNPLMVDNGRLFYDSNYPGDSGCGFDYTDVGADDASRKSDALFANFTYEIDDNTTFGLRGTFSRVDGTSRFAPAVGSYSMKAGQFDIIAPTYTFADGSTWGPDADGNYNDPLPSGTVVTGLTNTDNIVPAPADGFGLIRFTDNGNREMDSVADLYDIVMSLDGMLGTWNYNFSAQFSNQLSNEYGYNYINKYAYAQLAATDGFDPSDKATVDRYRQDTFERAENRYDNYFFGMGNDLTDEISIYLGMEYFEFGYNSRYDAGRNGINVIGSAGNSSKGERDNTAVFVEGLYIPSDIEGLEVSLSARQDDYSDFGEATTSKIGVAYDITDELFVRASFGDSFIPADMSSLYGSASESYPFARDFVSCDATGIAEVDCPRRQYATFYVSNPNLQPETSESVNMGLVWSPSFMAGNQSFSLDYYEITFEDLQSRITLQALINAERAGTLASAIGNTGAVLNRASNGKLSSAIEQASTLPLINSSDSEFRLEGMDVKYSSTWDIGPGALDVDLDATYYSAYESSTGTSKIDSVGANGVPEWRANLYLSYGWDDHTVRAAYYYIPETAETRDANDKLTGSIDAVGFLDVSYKYDTPWKSVVTIGMRNATDEGPPLDTRNNYDRGLYFMGHLGPVTYVTLSHSF